MALKLTLPCDFLYARNRCRRCCSHFSSWLAFYFHCWPKKVVYTYIFKQVLASHFSGCDPFFGPAKSAFWPADQVNGNDSGTFVGSSFVTATFELKSIRGFVVFC